VETPVVMAVTAVNAVMSVTAVNAVMAVTAVMAVMAVMAVTAVMAAMVATTVVMAVMAAGEAPQGPRANANQEQGGKAPTFRLATVNRRPFRRRTHGDTCRRVCCVAAVSLSPLPAWAGGHVAIREGQGCQRIAFA
jgi:hypothetical protein